MLFIKGLALLFVTCLAIIIVVGLLYLIARWVYEHFLSDTAKVKKELKELIDKYETLKKEIK